MGNQDPNPESQLNPDPIGIRNTVFREARSGFLLSVVLKSKGIMCNSPTRWLTPRVK
jgi:hypothetical protein